MSMVVLVEWLGGAAAPADLMDGLFGGVTESRSVWNWSGSLGLVGVWLGSIGGQLGSVWGWLGRLVGWLVCTTSWALDQNAPKELYQTPSPGHSHLPCPHVQQRGKHSPCQTPRLMMANRGEIRRGRLKVPKKMVRMHTATGNLQLQIGTVHHRVQHALVLAHLVDGRLAKTLCHLSRMEQKYRTGSVSRPTN